MAIKDSTINVLSVQGDLNLNKAETELHLSDGRIVRLNTALLQQQPISVDPPETTFSDVVIVPLIEEQLQIGKRTVQTGKVRLHKSTEAYNIALNEPLEVDTWKVQRVPKDEVVVDVPEPRRENGATIYSLVEERLILTKQLVLVEEIHVTREVSSILDTRTVTLHRDKLTVERDIPDRG